MSDVVVHADLCHKGNYENIVGQPDMVHTATPGVIPDLVWFVCPTEANGINMFPCTGSRHIDASTVVECTCRCHVVYSPGQTSSGATAASDETRCPICGAAGDRACTTPLGLPLPAPHDERPRCGEQS